MLSLMYSAAFTQALVFANIDQQVDFCVGVVSHGCHLLRGVIHVTAQVPGNTPPFHVAFSIAIQVSMVGHIAKDRVTLRSCRFQQARLPSCHAAQQLQMFSTTFSWTVSCYQEATQFLETRRLYRQRVIAHMFVPFFTNDFVSASVWAAGRCSCGTTVSTSR